MQRGLGVVKVVTEADGEQNIVVVNHMIEDDTTGIVTFELEQNALGITELCFPVDLMPILPRKQRPKDEEEGYSPPPHPRPCVDPASPCCSPGGGGGYTPPSPCY